MACSPFTKSCRFFSSGLTTLTQPPHTSLTVALAFAAVLYWIHAEVYPRRWPQIAEGDREAFALRVSLEADALVLLSAAVLAFHHVAPLLLFRLDYPDSSHHPGETAVLGIAALAYWIRAEVYPHQLPHIESGSSSNSSIEFDLGTWQAFAYPVTSLLGAAAAVAALWVVLPTPWVVVGWLTLVVVLGLAADWVKAETLWR